MKTDSPKVILQELSAQVVKEMGGASVDSFESALEEMTAFHKYLLEAYSFQEEDGSISTFAEAGLHRNEVHEEWIYEYYKILEAAAKLIGEENDFIGTVTRLPIDIMPPSYRYMTDKVVRRILGMPCFLVHRVEEWRISRLIYEKPAQPLHFTPQGRLSVPDKKAYENALSHMISPWEAALSYVSSFYEWKDAEKGGDDVLWDRLCRGWFYLFQHLENTAYMLASTVFHNDEQGAADFSSSLLRWRETVSFLFDNSVYFLGDEMVLPDLTKHNWEAAKAILEERKQGAYHISYTPKAVYGRLTYAAHTDMVLVLSGILMHWYLHRKVDNIWVSTDSEDGFQFGKQVQSGLPLNLCFALLRGGSVLSEDEDDDAIMPRKKFDFPSFMIAVLKLIAVSEYAAPMHSGYMDGVVRHIDGMTERRVISGRVFTPSTENRVDDLQGAWLMIALEMYSRNPAQKDAFITAFKGLLETKSLPDEIKIFKRLQRALKEFKNGLASFDAGLIAQMVQDIELIMEPNKVALEGILDEGEKLVDAKINSIIEQSQVDPEKVRAFEQSISAKLLTDLQKHLSPFEGVSVAQKNAANDGVKIERRVTGILKGAFTTPVLNDIVYHPDNFVSYTIQGIRPHIFRTLIEEQPHHRIPCRDMQGLWQTVRTKAAEAVAQGGGNLVLFGGTWLPPLLTAHAAQSQDQGFFGLTYHKKQNIRASYYLGTLDGVDVYFLTGSSLEAPNSVVLFPSKALQQIALSPFEKGSLVKVTHQEAAGKPDELELLLEVSADLTWQNEHIYRISVTPEAFAEENVNG